jgi:lysyl-tRNA synthetase class 1
MDRQESALKSNSWPFIEAQKILDKIKSSTPDKGYVLFETGYGPSGLPHIGTFGEVARTTMVMNAFKVLSDIPTKLICFSDDMDGLRKVPENLPNPELITPHLGKPLTSVPDPFGTHESFGHHMNARLRAFLDEFGFEYEFKSATEEYKSGKFDAYLLKALENYDKIMKVMIPTLGAERQATYSPFLPICPDTGVVLMVPIIARDLAKGTITYTDISGKNVEVKVTGGNCKLQWKPDFGVRWAALDVNFEMYGKDHLANGPIYSKICQIVGGKVPHQYFYELFLDEKGQKISKSKGNGVTMEEWLKYAPTESLSLFMYQSPQKAKRMYFDVIPKQVDEYIIYSSKYKLAHNQAEDFTSPLWHVHNGRPPLYNCYGINYSLLLNLASVCNPDDKSVLWGFISKYAPDANPKSAPFLDRLVDCAIKYYDDFVKPTKQFRTPTKDDQHLLHKIIELLKTVSENITTEELQNQIYAIGTDSGIELKEFFKIMYQILLGQEQGPRLGSFFKLYGINETINLINQKLG